MGIPERESYVRWPVTIYVNDNSGHVRTEIPAGEPKHWWRVIKVDDPATPQGGVGRWTGERLYAAWCSSKHTDRARYWSMMNPADKRAWERLAKRLNVEPPQAGAVGPEREAKIIEAVDRWVEALRSNITMLERSDARDRFLAELDEALADHPDLHIDRSGNL